MNAKDYKRWALDGLRERAQVRGISATGRKDELRLILRQRDDLSIFYQEKWWRSAFKRSGYGGSLWFESDGADHDINPAIVPLINLGDLFIPIRSPENTEQIDHFLDRLLQLADWCASAKLAEFQELARETGTALSKVTIAAKHLREFPFRA